MCHAGQIQVSYFLGTFFFCNVQRESVAAPKLSSSPTMRDPTNHSHHLQCAAFDERRPHLRFRRSILCSVRSVVASTVSIDLLCRRVNLLRGRQKLLLPANCSGGVLELRACLAWSCLQVIKLPLHVWRSCSLYLRFNKLEVMSICSCAPAMTSRAFGIPSPSDSSST